MTEHHACQQQQSLKKTLESDFITMKIIVGLTKIFYFVGCRLLAVKEIKCADRLALIQRDENDRKAGR